MGGQLGKLPLKVLLRISTVTSDHDHEALIEWDNPPNKMGKWNNLFQLTKSGECKAVSCGNHRQEFNAPNLLCQFGMFAFVGHNFGHVFQLKLCMSEKVGHTRQRVEPRDSPLREARL